MHIADPNAIAILFDRWIALQFADALLHVARIKPSMRGFQDRMDANRSGGPRRDRDSTGIRNDVQIDVAGDRQGAVERALLSSTDACRSECERSDYRNRFHRVSVPPFSPIRRSRG